MDVANTHPDPVNVVQSLVHVLLGVLDATRDLFGILKSKEKRDHEENIKPRGYPDSRRIKYVDDESAVGHESITLNKAAVIREFDIGFQDLGTQFAIGDVITQTALQSQIITLQSVLVMTFLYGPISPQPISHHISSLLAASRAAGTASADVLSAQHWRQLSTLPPTLQSTHSPVARCAVQLAPLYPIIVPPATSATSTAIVKSHHENSWSDSHVPTNPTISGLMSRPKATRSDTESTSFSGPTAYGSQITPHTLYCLYALDLQRHPTQPVSSTINSSSPHCPYCKRDLNLSPGKSWEIFKDDEGTEHCFHIKNRFVVKCHRDSVNEGYSCVICSRSGSVDTVCGDVKALIRHVWMDHGVGEMELEEDIVEVVENALERKKGSGLGLRDIRGRRGRSMSLGARRRTGKGNYEREVEIVEMRTPRGRVVER
ncbi:uncharacterized protein BDR25DRAFT_321872 [Lindgomyces ingoldianus]|uniref:Uncharacterized protein n=1 Tax=Lindgomyces ingoldianus TaxID=673940 RepID=A0ACB6RBA5_9PLEO|nr:uncharacterized protein BDR25DRAFT_321872 [Lindgomyces ingoldianus]KAF2476411.1 hypothetical protein BDR25DRAFT_321872 [Lindgomyces ingoldianus]